MKFYTARNCDDALAVLATRGTDATVIAGGTDVMLQIDSRELDTGFLLHIERVSELRGIELGDSLQIGALTTHQDLATSTVVLEHYPGLAEAAAQVGGWQTRSVGTIGGNICNASPAADLMAPLLVHNARVVLQSSARGERELALAEFVTGRRATTRKADELLMALQLDPPEPHSRDAYFKLGRRGATEIAIVGLAVRLRLDPKNDVIADARIASCATGAEPVRCIAAEAALTGSDGDDTAVVAAGAALLASVSNIDDVRATAQYRDRVLPGLLRRTVGICIDRVRDIKR